jgi:hypothetical protein
MASTNYLMKRVNTYPITNEARTKELNIIKDTLYNNKYNKNLSISHSKHHKHNKTIGSQHQTTKWASFTHCGKETQKITKLFKEAQISRILFKKHNTKPNKIPAADRQVQKKWHIPNEMHGLATKIYRPNRPNIPDQI